LGKYLRNEGENEVSWFQQSPTISLALIGATGVKIGARPRKPFNAQIEVA
jgi:hypothetical protein